MSLSWMKPAFLQQRLKYRVPTPGALRSPEVYHPNGIVLMWCGSGAVHVCYSVSISKHSGRPLYTELSSTPETHRDRTIRRL